MNLKKIAQSSIKTFAFVLATVSTISVFAATPPSQVQNVKAEIINDTTVNLTWDEATSEEGIVVGYKIYFGTSSVENEGESYDDEIEVEAQTSYPMENLMPGTRYYFALTALDDELNQSVNYSEEVFIDLSGVAPVAEEIIEEMEEPVNISKTVVLENQDVLMVTEGMVTLFNNRHDIKVGDIIVAGVLDNAPLGFNRKVVNIADNNGALVLETERASLMDAYANEEVISPLEDDSGANSSGFTYTFQQSDMVEEPQNASAPVDMMAPMDASGLSVDTSRLRNSSSVSLRWQKSANMDGDAADQMLYMKRGNNNWDNGYSIGKDLEEMVLDVEMDQNYQVRIVTIDDAGNSSNGATVSFSTETLAESGPGMLIPFAIIALSMFFFLSFRRRI